MKKRTKKIIRYKEKEVKRMHGSTNWARMIQEENKEKEQIKDKDITP